MARPGRPAAFGVFTLLMLLLIVAARPAIAQDTPALEAPQVVLGDGATDEVSPVEEAAPPEGSVGRESVVGLIRSANPLLWPLVACSIVAVGFTLERLVALRRSRVVPRDFVDRFLDRLSSGKLDRGRALELCRANDSAAARVFARVVHYWGQPAGAIREAVGHDAGGELVEMKRNVRVLNATTTLAPLLGLLGTVVGMIEAFDALGGRATAGASKGEALAHGISLALMATAFGLAIAIASVVAYYYLLNRIDVLVGELDRQATKVIDLVAGDAGRPIADRRAVPPGPSDLSRHEAMRS